MLIKDLTKVKDSEITLEDVRRAEALIERANKLLGRKTECNHYHGWNYWFNTPQYFNLPNTILCGTGATGTFNTVRDTTLNATTTENRTSLLVNTSITDFAATVNA